MRVRCSKCGIPYDPRNEHKCGKSVKTPATSKAGSIDKTVKALEEAIVQAEESGNSGPGTHVAVRIQPNLLARLDKARGAATRPAMIRTILDKALEGGE